MSARLLVSDRRRPRITKQPLNVGCLIYERMDQIDFTGPFEVLSRMPDTAIQVIGQKVAPVRDVQGLRLSPDVSIAEAGLFDVLLVPGGHGQQAPESAPHEVLQSFQAKYEPIGIARKAEAIRYAASNPQLVTEPARRVVSASGER
jgi:transcriptional regulator GlxA family with amidase domain